MKKQILELLRELENIGEIYPRVMFFKDCSGKYLSGIEDNYKVDTKFNFSSEPELIQGLKDKIKELNNK